MTTDWLSLALTAVDWSSLAWEEEDEVDELEKGDAVDDTVNDGVGAFGEGEFDVAGESDEESEAHRAVPPSSAYTSDAGM